MGKRTPGPATAAVPPNHRRRPPPPGCRASRSHGRAISRRGAPSGGPPSISSAARASLDAAPRLSSSRDTRATHRDCAHTQTQARSRVDACLPTPARYGWTRDRRGRHALERHTDTQTLAQDPARSAATHTESKISPHTPRARAAAAVPPSVQLMLARPERAPHAARRRAKPKPDWSLTPKASASGRL